MTPVARYQIWTATVLTIGLGLPAAFGATVALHHPRLFETAIAAIGFLLDAVLLRLIATTPSDAIRLRPGRSVLLITLGTAWLLAVSWACFDRTPFGAIVSVAAIAFAWLAAVRLVSSRVTPWLVAVALWHPGMVGPYATPEVMAVLAVSLLTATSASAIVLGRN